jgi:hypothetical protein
LEKVTKINVEGHEYGFAAGSVVEGSCASQASDWTKTVLLTGETGIVDGVFLSIKFTYGNTVGFDKPKTVYSSDGINFYYDQAMTEAVTLPPVRNYTATLVSGDEYLLEEYPVISIANVAYPVCNAHGKPCGGLNLWSDGDIAVILFTDSKFIVVTAVSLPVAYKQEMFDINHPIGELYIQYPSKKDPESLYNIAGVITSTWNDITAEYDGAFFRAYKSGTSGDFVDYGESLTNKMQASQNLNHTHGSGYTGYSGSLSLSGGNHRHETTDDNNSPLSASGRGTGTWSASGSGGGKYIYTLYSGSLTVSGGNHRHGISYSGDTEARPINYAIKVWERVS